MKNSTCNTNSCENATFDVKSKTENTLKSEPERLGIILLRVMADIDNRILRNRGCK